MGKNKQGNKSFDQYEDFSKEYRPKKNYKNNNSNKKVLSSYDVNEDDFFGADFQKNKSRSRREMNLQKKNEKRKRRFDDDFDDDYDYN